ncbi:MAG: DUF1684 domain-containing protein [Bacteroidales bacterium]
MSINSILLTIVTLFISNFTISAQSSTNTPSSDAFKEKVLQERKSKDAQCRDPKRSPLESADLQNFKGLKYYPYDSKYRVMAQLNKNTGGEIIRMKTTTERRPEYKTWAYAYFTLEGKKYQLTLYQPLDLMAEKGFENYLFLPFTDETSGRETYGGGRFLELTIPEGNSMIIDFNSAFNPYCAYNSKYSCPVPPQENDLNIKIESGELIYKDHAHH